LGRLTPDIIIHRGDLFTWDLAAAGDYDGRHITDDGERSQVTG
jgi:hypothetical protein